MNEPTATETANRAKRRRPDHNVAGTTRPAPIARGHAISMVKSRGGWWRIAIVDQCPYCGRAHLHRWPFRFPEVGTKTAGCRRGSYRVEVTP